MASFSSCLLRRSEGKLRMCSTIMYTLALKNCVSSYAFCSFPSLISIILAMTSGNLAISKFRSLFRYLGPVYPTVYLRRGASLDESMYNF